MRQEAFKLLQVFGNGEFLFCFQAADVDIEEVATRARRPHVRLAVQGATQEPFDRTSSVRQGVERFPLDDRGYRRFLLVRHCSYSFNSSSFHTISSSASTPCEVVSIVTSSLFCCF